MASPRPDPGGDRAGPDALLPPRDEARRGAGMSAASSTTEATTAKGYFRNPWRKPRFLQGDDDRVPPVVAAPGLIAVIFSFNDGRSRISWQGFSLRWWTRRPYRLAAPRRRDALSDGADLQAVDPDGADRGPARDAVRDRHRPMARTAGANRELRDAAVVRGARDHPRRLALHPVHEPAEERDPPGHERHSCSGSSASRSATRRSSCGPACSRSVPNTRRRRMDLGATPGQSIRRVLLPLHRAGDPRERRARVRRRRRRLRHGCRALGSPPAARRWRRRSTRRLAPPPRPR